MKDVLAVGALLAILILGLLFSRRFGAPDVEADKTVRLVLSPEEIIRRELSAFPQFQATNWALGIDSGVAIDEQASALCLLGGVREKARVFPAREIFASEVLVNGGTESSAVRSSQIAGAVVGGLLLGGVGAVIGGLSGKTTTRQKVSTVMVRVSVNDMQQPTHDIAFLRSSKNVQFDRDDAGVVSAIHQAEQLHARLAILIKLADRADASASRGESNRRAEPGAQLVTQLRDLAAMRANGDITEDEYQRIKAQLMVNTPLARSLSKEITSDIGA